MNQASKVNQQTIRRSTRAQILTLLAWAVIAIFGITTIAVVNGQNATQTVPEKRYKPELVLQTGHADRIFLAAFSPDGKIVASASRDTTIKLWNVETGQEVKSLTGHANSVVSVAFSPDGKTLASGSGDKTIKLWSVKTGQEIKSLTGHAGSVRSVVFSPDGKTLVSGSDDKTTKLWSVGTGQEIKSLTIYFGSNIAVSPDGKTLYSDVEVAISPDSKILASGSYDRTIKLWSVETGQEIRLLTGHADFIDSIVFSPDSKILVSGSNDGTIKLWSVGTGQEIKSLIGYSGVKMAISPDGKTLASGSYDKAIKLWNVGTGQEIKPLISHVGFVQSVVFSPDGKILASAVDNGTIKLWSIETGQQIKSLIGYVGLVQPLAFSPDGKTLASVGGETMVKLWNVETGKEIKSFKGHISSVFSVAFSPDGKILASGSYDRTVKLWNVESGQEIKSLTGHPGFVRSVAFSPDGKILASGSTLETIKLWNVESGQEIRSLTGYISLVQSVVFSPDGKTLASGLDNGTIKLWNIETGQQIKSLEGHISLGAVAFSPDGRTLVSGSNNGTAELWNVETGQQIKSLDGHTSSILSVAFSPDGKFFVSGSRDGTMKLWDMKNNKPLSTLTSLDKDDWVAVTPDSQFDASAGASKLMHFVVSDPSFGYEVITLDQLKSKSFTPGLLKDIFLQQRTTGADNFSITLYPNLEIEQSKTNATMLDLKLENRGGGIGRVEVRVNGREFLADASAGKIGNRKIARAVIPVEIPKDRLDAGANKVEVIVWNTEGDVRSREREFGLTVGANGAVRGSEIVRFAEEKQTYNGHFYAIVAGISEYANPAYNLRYAAKDAEDMSKALALGARRLFCGDEMKNKKPCGRVHLRTLTTEKQARFDAPADLPDTARFAPTKAELQKVFAEVAARAKPEDVVVVYLSGHGTAITHPEATEKSAFPDMYLYPTAEAATIDAAQLKNKTVRDPITVSSLELADWVNQIKAERKVMIFDTCAAGNLEKSDLTAMQTKADDALQIRALDRLRERTGFYVLMGSAANAVSYEASAFRQGLLTYSLLEALTGARLREDKFVDVEDWFGYAEDKVELLARNIGGIQRPRYFKSNFSRRFDVGQIEPEERRAIQPASAVPIILQPRFIDEAAGFDSLELEDNLIAKLQTLSVRFERGTAQAVNYIPARRAAGGAAPSGSYKIAGETVTVSLVLRRDNQEIARLEVAGAKSEIAEKLLAAIISAARKEEVK